MDASDRDRIIEALVSRRAEQFALLRDLVRIDTSPSSPSISEAADSVAALLERFDFTVERHSVEDGTVVNLVSRAGFGDGPTVALVCHVDTAPVGDGWKKDPFKGDIADGAMFGAGTLSGKAHLSAQVFAILALVDAEIEVGGTIELHMSFAGEGGGAHGAKWMLADDIVRPDFAIVGGPSQTVVTHATGSLVLEVDVLASPATETEDGSDALEGASAALTRIFQFRGGLSAHVSKIPGLGAPTLVVEHFSSGAPGAGVPTHASMVLRRSILPDEDVEQVEKQLTTLMGSTIARTPGVRCRIRRTSLVPAMTDGDGESPLASVFREELAAFPELDPEPHGASFENEGRHYVAAGIPTVIYGAGPLDPVRAGMYGPDECVDLDDVRFGTQTLTLGLARFLEG